MPWIARTRPRSKEKIQAAEEPPAGDKTPADEVKKQPETVEELVDASPESLELLKNEKFDLILLDMIMPGGIDGTETFEKALKLDPNQKAIIVSGFAESDKVKEARELGTGDFSDIIPKLKKEKEDLGDLLVCESETGSDEDDQNSNKK